MKRTPLKRGTKTLKRTPLKKKSGFKKKTKPLKRTPLRRKSKSRTALIKQEIQNTLRLLVAHRDGGCVLRKLRCGNDAKVIEGLIVSEAVIQADHLLTRSNSATYANPDLVVCICQPCHGWKHYHKKEYDKLIRTVLSKEIVDLWDLAIKFRHSHKTVKMDWNLQLVGLQLLLKDYENN